MSNDKMTTSIAANDPVTASAGGQGQVTATKKPADHVEVVSLEVDENDDFGGDPYNRTGSHCIIKLTDDAER